MGFFKDGIIGDEILPRCFFFPGLLIIIHEIRILEPEPIRIS